MLAVYPVVLSCRGKYFKGFKPAIARMVTRLEFRLCAGNVLGLTVQLMHIKRQEVCYAPALPCGNARVLRRNKIYDVTNIETIMSGNSVYFQILFFIIMISETVIISTTQLEVYLLRSNAIFLS